MIRFLFVFYAIGPALLGYAAAYLLKNPNDWTGPAIVIPLSGFLSLFIFTSGTKWLKKKTNQPDSFLFPAVQAAGVATGLILFVLMYFFLLD